MPTNRSNKLKLEVLDYLENNLGDYKVIANRPFVLLFRDKRVYLRVAIEKAGDKYWYDINPKLFIKTKIDFLVYACGKTKSMYVFPAKIFFEMIRSASLGGVNQVPNFTIFIDSHELEPAGKSEQRFKIKDFWNKFTLINQ
jgi:hypothetical protein